jgi:hypothetical protein
VEGEGEGGRKGFGKGEDFKTSKTTKMALGEVPRHVLSGGRTQEHQHSSHKYKHGITKEGYQGGEWQVH